MRIISLMILLALSNPAMADCIDKPTATSWSGKMNRCAAIYHFVAIANLGLQQADAGEKYLTAERAIVILLADMTYFSDGSDYAGAYNVFMKTANETLDVDDLDKILKECKSDMQVVSSSMSEKLKACRPIKKRR